MTRRQLAVLLLLVVSLPAQAAGERLRQFLADTRSARAQFEQTVTAKDNRRVERASGNMMFSRPGKFRWNYAKPYEQLIVGDGAKVWIYDKELNQVTVKPLSATLGSTPAALLAGSNEFEREFEVLDGPKADGLDWVEARPRVADSLFAQVRLGFRGNLLERMELRDNFGQMTALRFLRFERNPKLAADNFRFQPPAGADVVGE